VVLVLEHHLLLQHQEQLTQVVAVAVLDITAAVLMAQAAQVVLEL
jgi:hypothetical protein